MNCRRPDARCKNKRPDIIPLSEPALALLRGIPSDGKYVFGRFLMWTWGKNHLDKRIAARRGGAPLPHWTLHDLRRSFTTHVNEPHFAQPRVIEAILNHVSESAKSGVAGVYNKAVYLDEQRQAPEQWAAYLTGQVARTDLAPIGAGPALLYRLVRAPTPRHLRKSVVRVPRGTRLRDVGRTAARKSARARCRLCGTSALAA